MELFNEVYGCYFTVVSRILNQAEAGLTKSEIEKLVSDGGFYDSAFHLLPALFPAGGTFSGEWNLLREDNKIYYSRLLNKIKRPLTILEKSWLKALTADARIKLFLEETQLNELRELLNDIEPLFINDNFHVYDKHLDGDDYNDGGYAERFKVILKAINEEKSLIIEYDSPKNGRTKRQYHPYKLCYSARDDKFRLQCAAYKKQLQRITLNLARITGVQISETKYNVFPKVAALFEESPCGEPVIIEISKERNALERCMLQFASFERQTEYDKERDIFTCRIWYDSADETELLIRILSFGPVIKVLEPSGFLNQIKERIRRQININN
jgi:uncharacterized protein YktA (UPF0223 family)